MSKAFKSTAKMFKAAVKVTCMVILASFFYDVLSCNRFHKTQTYKYIKQVGSSKTGKMLLKKIKKAKKKYLKAALWPSYGSPCTDETGNQVKPYVNFVNDWPGMKNQTVSLIQELVVYLGKNFPFLSSPVSLSFENLVESAKAGAALVSRHLHTCADRIFEYFAKVV